MSLVASQLGLRQAAESVAYCVAGAVIGGVATFGLAGQYPNQILSVINKVPAISSELIENVAFSIQQEGLWAMFIGSLSGVPYKIFAAQAGIYEIGMAGFVLATIPSRAFRFILVVILTSIIFRMVLGRTNHSVAGAALMVFWLGFYGYYFSAMSN